MRKYPQLSILYPRTAFSISVIVMLLLAAVVAISPPFEAGVVNMLRDQAGVGAAVFGVLLIIVGFVFRQVQAMLFTAVVMSIGVLGACAFTSVFDVRATMSIIPVAIFVMALGVAYSTYIGYAFICEVLFERGKGRTLRDHRYILSEAVRKVRDAVLFSSAVLCIGFLSLRFSSWPELASLGLLLAVGTATVALAALIVTPALIAWWPFPVKDKTDHNQLTNRLLDKLSSSAIRQPKVYLAITALITVVAGVAAGARGRIETETLSSLAIVCGVILVLMVLGFRSTKLAILAFLGSCLPVILGVGIYGLMGRPLDLPVVVAGAIMLGLSVTDTMYLFSTFLSHRKYFTPSSSTAAEEMLADVGRPVIFSSWALIPGFGIMLFSSNEGLVGMGILLCVTAVSTTMVNLLLTPAMLSITDVTRPEPTQSEIDLLGKFKKLRADAPRQSFDDYADDEILSMFTGDFLALSGKRVIRQGGTYGTRRMFYELDIKPGMKVLEIGTGVGASCFDIAEHYDVQITSVDLSAYMVSVAKELTRQRGFEDKINIIHVTDGSHYPFEDNTFDLVITEAIVMYADPDAIFSEAYRVLKPGGRIGFHDWSWPQKPNTQFEELTCIIACGCNLGDIRIQSKAEWTEAMEKWNFHTNFADEYPFNFFALSGMRDDEGTLGVIRIFARVFKRRATIHRMMRMIFFLGRYDGAFSFTIIVGEKRASLESSDVVEKKNSLEASAPPDAAVVENNVLTRTPL